MLFKSGTERYKKDIIKFGTKYKIDVLQDEKNIDTIKKLNLNNRQIDKIPASICCLSNLEVIDLSFNKLVELPSEFGDLKNLKSINLGFNRFENIPESICNLENLEVLSLDVNKINSITSSISKLKNLRELNLFANQIPSLPDEIGMLTNLRKLNLALNKLTELPKTFSNLINLSDLEIWLNKFTTVPEELKKLSNLKDIEQAIDSEKLNKTLIWAVTADNTYLADKLIFHGADVNYKDETTQKHLFTTPLFEAKSIDMITLLLSMGADPTIEREIIKFVQTSEGETYRRTGKYESFFTKEHPKEIEKYKKAYLDTLQLLKK